MEKDTIRRKIGVLAESLICPQNSTNSTVNVEIRDNISGRHLVTDIGPEFKEHYSACKILFNFGGNFNDSFYIFRKVLN